MNYPQMHQFVNAHLHNALPHYPIMDIKSILSANLIRYRNLKGFTQGKLATKSGVRQSTVSRIENKETAADVDTIAGLARGLGISSWQLLTEEEARTITKSDAELLATIKKLARG